MGSTGSHVSSELHCDARQAVPIELWAEHGRSLIPASHDAGHSPHQGTCLWYEPPCTTLPCRILTPVTVI